MSDAMSTLRFMHRYYDQSTPPDITTATAIATRAARTSSPTADRPRRRQRDLPSVESAEQQWNPQPEAEVGEQARVIEGDPFVAPELGD
jgi:hypothetical protein